MKPLLSRPRLGRRLHAMGCILLFLSGLLFGALGCQRKSPEAQQPTPAAAVAALPATDADATSPPGDTASPDPAATSTGPAPLPVPSAYYDKVQGPLREIAGEPSPQGAPVLFIIIDALNARHLRAYGHHRATSPHIDAVAQDGVIFTNWVSNAPWTRPSFTTLITGATRAQHRVELTGQNLGDDIATMAQGFRDAGYQTAGFVGNSLVRKMWGFGRGFAIYEDDRDHGAFPRAKVIVDKALSFLAKHHHKPYFLMLFITDPHTPYRPVGAFRNWLDEVDVRHYPEYPFLEYKKPLPAKTHEAILAAYDGSVAYADDQLGRIFQWLKAQGTYDETTIVITADHGEIFGEHNCYLHGYHMWEPVLRVPFIAKAKGLPSGQIDDRPRTHIDLMPSLFEMHGIALPDARTGISFLSAFPAEERLIFSQYRAQGIWREAVRMGKWKLIHHHTSARQTVYRQLGGLSRKIPRAHPADLPSINYGAPRFELYDLLADPGELNDIYADHAEAPYVQQMKAFMAEQAQWEDSEIDAPQLSNETLEALRAAGYIQ